MSALFLIVISLIPLLDLFHPGLPITHDGQDHVARIANFYQNLEEGNIIPRWAAKLNWGYGHPILMFLYPLPSYMASAFHFVGYSLFDSTKLVFGITYLFSSLAMYLWAREFLGKRAAFVSALLYTLAPYRFVDLYVRGAIGEHVAFVFPPLILYFLLKLSKRFSYRYIVGVAFSLAGLILSHNAISLMFLPLIFLYAIYLLWQAKERKLLAIRYTICAILGLGLPAFFWFPAFFEGKYTLRDIVTSGEYASRFASFQSLLYGKWDFGGSGQFTTQIGILHWIMVALSVISIAIFRKKNNALWALGIGSFLVFWLTLFLMTEQSRIVWENITTLQKFQFPWRFLSITVFTTSVLGGLVIFTIPKKFQLVACCLVLSGLLFLNKDYWHAKGYLLEHENFFTGIYRGTTDTGESSPRWSVRFMEKEPNARIEVIDGKAQIKEEKRRLTVHTYEIEAPQQARIRENTLYFPGWEVFVDGQKIPTEFQDPANRGIITFFVEEGKHSIEIRFTETKLRLFANYISLASLFMLFVLIWRRKQIPFMRS